MGTRADNMPSISSYRAAYSRWETTKPIRGRGWDCRPLGNRKHTNYRIEKSYGDKIECVMYHTSCVIFHPDDSIEINPYRSKSTNDFVNAILRNFNVRADFDHSNTMVWMQSYITGSYEKVGYGIDSRFRIVRDPVHPTCMMLHPDSSDTDTFDFTVVNRSKGRAALAGTNYPQLSPWINAVRAIGGRNALIFPKVERYGFQIRDDGRKNMTDAELIECLAEGPDGWKRMVEARGPGCVNEVRMALYAKAGDVFETETRPYLVGGWRAYQDWQDRAKKFYNYI